MKKTLTWLGASVPVVFLLGMQSASAGITCRVLKDWCQAPVQNPPHHQNVGVPEPATLTLLATGFGAAGFAAWRRRKNNKD